MDLSTHGYQHMGNLSWEKNWGGTYFTKIELDDSVINKYGSIDQTTCHEVSIKHREKPTGECEMVVLYFLDTGAILYIVLMV